MANYATNAKELDKKWQDLYANKPVPTENPWEQKSQEYLSQYENRTPFSYNVNEDALYQQYKDQYVQQGKLASMDTMGQAAAMTGGYGNSYAQGAGQQAYQMYLSRLNDIVPQLQEMAYSRHNQEGQDMLTNYSLYKGLSDEIRNQDEIALDNWYRELEFISGERDTAEARAANERNNLINLIQNTGYEPSAEELEAAGITSGEANALKGAYNTYLSSLQKTEEPNAPTYTVLDYEEQAKWEKKFEKATSLADVERYADQMEAANVDPKVVASWVEYYSQQFIEDEPKYPHNYKIYDPERRL